MFSLNCGQRISVVGTSGSGKTTLARQISQRLSIPHVELDALHWEPNWTEAPLDIFRKRVEQSLILFKQAEYAHLKVVHLRSPQATQIWLSSFRR